MSFFLLQLSGWPQESIIVGKGGREEGQSVKRKAGSFRKFDSCIMKHLNKHREFTTILTKEDCESKTYSVYFQNIGSVLKGLLTFVYKKKKDFVSVLFHFLDKDGQFQKFQSTQMLNQFLRAAFQPVVSHSNLVKLVLNNENGSVCLQIAYFSPLNSNLLQDMDRNYFFRSKNIILDIYRKFVQPFIPLFEKAFRRFIPLQRRCDGQEQSKLMQNMVRYLKMMTVKSHLGSGVLKATQARVKQIKEREECSRKLFERQVVVSKGLTQSLNIFAAIKQKADKKYPEGTHQFYLSASEEASLLRVISMDSGPQNQSHHANILNYVRINNPQNMKTNPLNWGGFANLESAEVHFWYVDSYGTSQTDDLTPKNIQRRYMAIKRENRPHGKNLHEYKILSQMRNGISPLFAKYYIPVNMPQNDFKENPLLMMDFLPDGNLVQYIRNRKKCISLGSKVYMLLSIVAGLRYLETYRIVHLDLKPNNIMLTSGLNTKIIDFGQAYHTEVCKQEGKAYRPGFTLPYSPPELILGLKHGYPITSKGDIYSLGIVMFETLYGKVPIEHRERWFFASENGDIYGDPVLMRALNWVISRCLSKNPELRPQLDWISLILRLILDPLL